MPGRRVNIATIGDSVMWGQGLRERQKFTTLVAEWIAAYYGKEARVVARYAHSGARIGRRRPIQIAGPTDARGDISGEIPRLEPDIRSQLNALVFDDRFAWGDVDLLLVNGGANDGAFDDFVFPAGTLDDVRDAAGVVRTRMEGLLRDAILRLPSATIVVPGYYPLFSNRSLMSLMMVYVTGAMTWFNEPPDAPLTHLELIERSRVWARASNRNLAAAVEAVQADYPSRQLAFAPVPFEDANCMFAPQTWLWGFESIPLESPNPVVDWGVHAAGPLPLPEDPIRDGRLEICAREHLDDGDAGDVATTQFCYYASLGHPNIRGARAYARAIRGALVALWGVNERPPHAELPSAASAKESIVLAVAAMECLG